VEACHQSGRVRIGNGARTLVRTLCACLRD